MFLSSLGFGEELRILCWEGYAPAKYTAKFEKMILEKYDVDLKVVVKNVSAPEEFFDQIRGMKVDLISPAHNIPKSHQWPFIRGGVVLPVNLNHIPNYKNIIPALQKADYLTEGEIVYGVPIVYGQYGLAYNTNIIKDAPESWNVFWDPKYAGKYTISSDYHEANIYITALALGYDENQIFNYDDVNVPKVNKRLKTLAKNAKSLWVGVDDADGMQGLALATSWGFSFPKLKQRGEVWKFAHPKEGVTGWIDNWMIGYSLEYKPVMKQIAEEWINYSIGTEMQLEYVRSINQCPVNISIVDKLTPEETELHQMDQPGKKLDDLVLWKPLTRRSQNGFKSMWSKAK